MNDQEKYTKFALVREMTETSQIIRNFKLENADNVVEQIKQTGKWFISGEGSSRLFPSKNVINLAMKAGLDIEIASEGSYQAAEYDLSGYVVFASSNSGRTKETLHLCNTLKKAGHNGLFGLTANRDTRLESVVGQTFVISCGDEEAVAATKSYMEQALFYQALLAKIQGESIEDELDTLADAVRQTLTADIAPAVTQAVAGAKTVYFAGRNDGVAEELTVKANEIIRKKSDFLEGTSYMHGAQEVMNPEDVVILIAPYKEELQKTKDVLQGQVGLKVIAVATEDTIFPTVKVRDLGDFTNYLYMAAGWNILVEAGVKLGINLDVTERAQKVGNA